MICNSLIYIALATFAIAFALDLAATIRQAWKASAPVAPVASLPDPWTLLNPITPATAATVAPTTSAPQRLLAAAKENVTSPVRIVSAAPQAAINYNSVLTVEQLRRKAKQAGIKNSAKMRKNQLLTALAGC